MFRKQLKRNIKDRRKMGIKFVLQKSKGSRSKYQTEEKNNFVQTD